VLTDVGGTHLPTTKDVGKIEVKSIRRKNNITKISYSVS
jgi:Ser-tRNA(Ala) deacylase AlaX